MVRLALAVLADGARLGIEHGRLRRRHGPLVGMQHHARIVLALTTNPHAVLDVAHAHAAVGQILDAVLRTIPVPHIDLAARTA